jgi:hypothetical protein
MAEPLAVTLLGQGIVAVSLLEELEDNLEKPVHELELDEEKPVAVLPEEKAVAVTLLGQGMVVLEELEANLEKPVRELELDEEKPVAVLPEEKAVAVTLLEQGIVAASLLEELEDTLEKPVHEFDEPARAALSFSLKSKASYFLVRRLTPLLQEPVIVSLQEASCVCTT